MSKRSLQLLVEDIWESIEKIERYTDGMAQSDFENDDKYPINSSCGMIHRLFMEVNIEANSCRNH